MKLLIALNEDNGIESKLSEHFGHCPFFGIHNTETKETEIVKNEINHSAEKTPVDQVMAFEPDAVFTLGVGQRAIKLFAEKNVILKTGNFNTLKEVIEHIDDLKELDSGCAH